MDKVLIPVDYSDISCNAIKYAQTQFPNAELTVLHIEDRSLDSDYRTIYGTAAKSKELIKFIKKGLAINEMPKRMKIEVRYGTVVPTIKEFIKFNKFDFLVMGTRDKYNLLDNWFGTVSLGVVKSIKIPCYVIPKYADYKPYKKVIVASDKHLIDKSFIRIIKNWNTEFNAHIKFLHIQNDQADDYKEIEANIVEELFENSDVSFGFEIEQVKGSSISGSLLASAYNFGADLMVVLPENQTFLNAMIFQSLSKDLILKSDIPLLFIHPNNFVH